MALEIKNIKKVLIFFLTNYESDGFFYVPTYIKLNKFFPMK